MFVSAYCPQPICSVHTNNLFDLKKKSRHFSKNNNVWMKGLIIERMVEWDRIVEDHNLPVRTSRGRRTMTASQLNMSWTVAPANARRKSPTSVIWPMETSVFVTEVPMLAPITIGIACLTSRTENQMNNLLRLYWILWIESGSWIFERINRIFTLVI